jgi:hypothetical protein
MFQFSGQDVEFLGKKAIFSTFQARPPEGMYSVENNYVATTKL